MTNVAVFVVGLLVVAVTAHAFFAAYGWLGLIPAAVILMALARD